MAKVPNAVEIVPKISNRLSRAHERYRRQTDGRAIAYSEREGEFTFAKNDETHLFYEYVHNIFALGLTPYVSGYTVHLELP